jgi:hypothetical protein
MNLLMSVRQLVLKNPTPIEVAIPLAALSRISSLYPSGIIYG